jgi:glutamine amidotransferase-like uncharacterized protein
MKFVEKLKHCFTIEQVTPDEIIQQNILEKFHVLFVGGGMPAEHYKQMKNESGKEAIQRFVKQGGGYIGTCAGAYTAISWDQEEPLKTFSPSWELLPHIQIRDRMGHVWKRGMGTSKISLTSGGKKIFSHESDEEIAMFFQNGPLFECTSNHESTILGVYNNEVNTEKNPNSCMIGSGAIGCGTYGNGRVIVFSAHPESSGMHVDNLLINAFKYVSNS